MQELGCEENLLLNLIYQVILTRITKKKTKVPKKEGWLTKQGGSIKTWKKRFFVLETTKLAYYKEEEKVFVSLFDLEAFAILLRMLSMRSRKQDTFPCVLSVTLKM